MKKILCLLLALVLVFSFSGTAFACSPNAASYIEQIRSRIMDYVFSSDNFIARAVVRAQFKTAARAGAAIGCETASALLEHSLQRSPEDIYCESGSEYADQILISSECRALVSRFREEADRSGKSYYEMKGTVELRSTADLYLSYNSVSYRASGSKGADGRWQITFTFEDTYDFSRMAWEQSVSLKTLISIVNNYAYCAQSLHVIEPYHITVIVSTAA